MRIMLDTNVLVSALAFPGVCAELLDVVLAEHHALVAQEALRELERVLTEKFAFPLHRAREAVAVVGDQATVVHATRPAAWPLRDPDDRWIVGAALDHGADILVTGDRDILEETQSELKTVGPRDLLDLLRRQ